MSGFSGGDDRTHVMLSSKIFRKVLIKNSSSGNCQVEFLKFSLKDVYDSRLSHRRTSGNGRGGAAAPQILGNSDFLGSKRKFGHSQFLKTFELELH